MKRLIFIALLPLMMMAGCEERNVVSNEDKSYNTFELQPSKTATISIDSYRFNITVFDFDDKVESYGNEECGLGDGNRFFVNMEINGQEIIAHSEIGGPDEYSMPLDKAAENVAQKLESIAENGANADYRTIFERSTEIDDSYMISFDYAAPNRYTSSSTTEKEDYKFVFTIYSKGILP